MITLQERVHTAPKPDDWQFDKLHQVFRVRRGNKNTGMKEDNLLSLSFGRIIQKDIETADGLLPENFEGYQIVEPGNIVLRLTDLQNDKRSLRQGLVTQRGIITSAYDAVEVQRDNDPRFWFYSLLALDLAKHYYSLGGGVRQSVKFADFPNDWVYRPDLPTQRQIADFLDRETARIDLLIEKKQRLVALTWEKAVAFREMSIRSDNLTRIKFLSNYITSGSRDWGDLYSDEGCLFIRIGNVSGSNIDLDLRRKTFVDLGSRSEGLRTRLKIGDLLVSITADLGSVAVVSKEAEGAYINQHLALVRLNASQTDPRFVAHAMVTRASSDQFALRGYGGTKQGLSLKDVAEISIPLPPRIDQSQLAEELDAYFSRQSILNNKVEMSINRLREYRTALITAAVTGQINVETYAKSGTPDRRLDAIQEEMSA